ncbi:MAG: hypothetical protein WCL06_12285 [Bacteroidota bacterium]
MRIILKLFFLFISAFLGQFALGQNKGVNPTGTYILDNKAIVIEKETYGYAGLIQVKTLSENKILMTFTINKGAPSYNSGSFVDTLSYLNNQAIFTIPESDASCQITFMFTESGVTVKEKAKDLNTACGFGHAVVADGFFKKVSSLVPVLRNPGTGEILK